MLKEENMWIAAFKRWVLEHFPIRADSLESFIEQVELEACAVVEVIPKQQTGSLAQNTKRGVAYRYDFEVIFRATAKNGRPIVFSETLFQKYIGMEKPDARNLIGNFERLLLQNARLKARRLEKLLPHAEVRLVRPRVRTLANNLRSISA